MHNSKFKKFLAFLLIALMMLELLPGSPVVSAAEEATFSGIENKTISAGEYVDFLEGVSAVYGEESEALMVEIKSITKTPNLEGFDWDGLGKPNGFLVSSTLGDMYTVTYEAIKHGEVKGIATRQFAIPAQIASPIQGTLESEPTSDPGHTQNLVVHFLPLASIVDGVKSGNVATMLLSVTLSDPNPDAFAEVRIDIPDVPNLSLPIFSSGNTTELPDGSMLTLVTENNGHQYLKFRISGSGGTLNSEITFAVPNGTTKNNVVVPFTNDCISVTDRQFSGDPDLRSSGFFFMSDFGWHDLTITKNIYSSIMINNSGYLSQDPSWTISALNEYNIGDRGVIFTADYTMTSTITLPEGLSYRQGTGSLAADGRSYLVDGVKIAEFSQKVTSASIDGQKLLITYFVDNETLDANGDVESGKTATDLSNLDFYVKLIGKEIAADTARITSTVQIINDATFEANSCKDNLTSESDGSVSMAVSAPAPNVSLNKTSSLGTGTFNNLNTYIKYTLVATNDGSKNIATVVVSDQISSLVDFVNDASRPATPGFTYNSGTRTISWTIQDMSHDANDANQRMVFEFWVKPKSTLTGGETIYNRGKVTFEGNRSNDSNQTSNRYIAPTASISLSKTNRSGENRDLNDPIEWRIVVSNTGTATSNATTIVDEIPASLEIDETRLPTGAIVEGQKVTIPVPAISSNSSRTFTIHTTVKTPTGTGTKISNTARLSGGGYNNSASDYYYYRHLEENFSFGKARTSGATTYKGQIVSWQLTCRNTGNIISTPRTIVDMIPDGLTITTESLNVLINQFGAANVEYIQDFEDGKDKLTIKDVRVASASTVLINIATTCDRIFPNGTILVNVATVDDEDYEASVTYQEPLPSGLIVDKRVPFSDGSSGVQNPRKVRIEDDNAVKYAVYEIDYILNVRNTSANSTTYLQNKLQLIDTMQNGLRPHGAGLSLTSGTITGTINSNIASEHGKTIVGRWSKQGNNYVINWTFASTTSGSSYAHVPDMEPGEYWGVVYTGECFARMRPDGTYDSIVVTNTGSVSSNGSGVGSGGAIVGGGGANGWIRPEAVLTKRIVKQNNTTMDRDQCSIYSGDVITYKITAKNDMVEGNQSHPLNGTKMDVTLTDTLPRIRAAGASLGFAWVLDDNVKIKYPNGYTGPQAVMSSLVNGDGSVDYFLIWTNVELDCQESVVYEIELAYPIGQEFNDSFGIAESVLTNKVALTNNQYMLDLRAQADHTIKKNTMTLSKYANKSVIDAAAENESDRIVTWTLTGFNTSHYAALMLL